MNPTELYQHLKDLAARLDIRVAEQNFRATGVNAKSGFCIVKEEKRFIMDKHLTVREKLETLGDYLKTLTIADPGWSAAPEAVRKFLERGR